jgi:hypothetical protein
LSLILTMTGTFDGIAVLGKGHFAGNAVKLFDLSHRIPDALAIGFQVAGNFTTAFDRLLHDMQRVPGQSTYVVRYIPVFFVIAVDKGFGCAGRAGGSIMGGEEKSIAVLAAKFYRFRRSPAVAADNGLIPAELMSLLYNQGDFVIILGRKQYFRTRLNNF